MYMYGQAPLLFTQKYHNIVNRLLPQYNIKSLKFEKQGKKYSKLKKKNTISVKSTESVSELASFT